MRMPCLMTIEPGEVYISNDGQRVVAGFLRHQRVWYGRQVGAYPFSMGVVAFLDEFKLVKPEKRVTVRMMKRFYFDGRGYNSKKSAYRMAAKYDLRKLVREELQKEHPSTEEIEALYVRMFPHEEDFSCGKESHGGTCREDGNYETYGNSMAWEDLWVHEGWAYAWCKTKWKAWLDAKAAELMAIDERKV